MSKDYLTAEREQSIVDFLKAGVPAIHAVRASGIGERTYYDWRNRGQEHEESCEGDDCKDKEHKYLVLVQRTDRAKSEAVAAYSIKLRDLAGAGDVRAITFYLSHVDRDNWYQRTRNELVGEDGEAVTVKLQWPDSPASRE